LQAVLADISIHKSWVRDHGVSEACKAGEQPMRGFFRFGTSIPVLLFSACGPPAPIRLQSPPLAIYRAVDLKNRTPTAKAVHDELEISVEEFVSKEKSREFFDADLAAYGVLALLVTLVNSGSHDYLIERDTIRAFLDGKPLVRLLAKEAADSSTALEFDKRVRAQDIAYGILILNPAGIVVFVSHWLDCLGKPECNLTQEREKRKTAIEYDREHIPPHFEKMELKDTPLPAGQKTEGFVYFKFPDDSDKPLDKITLELISRNPHSGKQTEYKIPLVNAR
jgi:hypothetical protein